MKYFSLTMNILGQVGSELKKFQSLERGITRHFLWNPIKSLTDDLLFSWNHYTLSIL